MQYTPQYQVAKVGASVALNVVKSAAFTFIPFWSGVFLAVGITWWWQNKDNKDTTPKTIGQVLTGIGGALYLITLIIFFLHFRRMNKTALPQMGFPMLPRTSRYQAAFGRFAGVPIQPQLPVDLP